MELVGRQTGGKRTPAHRVGPRLRPAHEYVALRQVRQQVLQSLDVAQTPSAGPEPGIRCTARAGQVVNREAALLREH